jgi:hypothetical protein
MILPSSFSKSDHIPNSLIHSSIYLTQIPSPSSNLNNSQFFYSSTQIPSASSNLNNTQFIYSSAQIPFSILKSDHVPNSFSHQHKFHSPSPNLIIYPNSFINTKFPFSIFKSDQLIHSFIHSSTQIPSPSFSPLVIHHLDFILSMDFHQF